jgi:hypothetical protein
MEKSLVGMGIRWWILRGILMSFEKSRILTFIKYLVCIILGVILPYGILAIPSQNSGHWNWGLLSYLLVFVLGLFLLFKPNYKGYGISLLLSSLINIILFAYLIYIISNINFA